jgi:hypothetical protein
LPLTWVFVGQSSYRSMSLVADCALAYRHSKQEPYILTFQAREILS